MKRVLPCFALLAGCVGYITGGGDEEPAPEGPRDLCASGERDIAGPRLLRRLTSNELTAGVRAAFGLSAAEWAGPALPADPAGRNGFTNNVDRLVVDDAYAAGLFTTAEAVADAVVAPARLSLVLPCAASGGGEACARTYLDTIGRRLYRRPLTDDERARFLDLHARVTAQDDFATWVRWATVAMVQSPSFVYRHELGEAAGGGYRLTGYELATALAFSLTGAPPDDALLDAAGRGELDSPPGVAAAARALALDGSGAVRPAMRAQFLAFTDQWLGLSTLGNLVKSGEDFPDFTAQIRGAMQRETEDFIARVVFEQRGGVADLLTSTESVVAPALATYYGWPATAGGPSVRPDGWGVGLLAQGSLLAINAGNAHTSPTQRGLLVRERFLCGEMPPPPPVVGDIPPPTGAETTRQRYEAHAQGSCAGCHEMMDPIGFAFEHLDAGGKYRATEAGFPIDATGHLAGSGVTFDGPVELASVLAAQPETSACVAAFVASYTYGLDHNDTSCLVTSLGDQLARGELGLLDYTLALTTTRHFTERVD